jgi:glycosyltransferase involved in cell wall biosynthesis
MDQNKISIIIPILNGEKSIRGCLTSVLSQDTPIYECIIVDNNSKDKTAEIVQEFQKEHPNLIYVFEPVVGRGSARNAGIARATGDIIAMTDVDCVVPSNWITELTKLIITGEEVVTTGYQYNTITGNYWAEHMQKKCDYFLERHLIPPQYISFTDTKNLAIRASLIKEFKFDSRFKALEDVDLEFRLRPVARFRYLPDVKVGHAHSETMRSVWKLAYERSYWFAQAYHKFKGVHDSNGILIFGVIPAFHFYKELCKINIRALRDQGMSHLLFFLVFDFGWKLGSAVGYAKRDKAFSTKN